MAALARRRPARPATGVHGRRTGRRRLDVLVAARGLAPSRHQAEAAIRAGEVFVNDERIDKPGALVAESSVLQRRRRGPSYVSRGGTKLAAALDAFGVDPRDGIVVDVGASTGGFTDCVLQRGARRVYAIDVGRGQLHWRLRQDPRVVVMEGRHAAHLSPEDLPEAADLAVVDCSFISLLKVLPAAARLMRPGGRMVVLVKPQFEAGPKGAPKGVVRDPAVHEAVLRRVVRGALLMGLTPARMVPSPLRGPDGNREFFLLLLKDRGAASDDLDGEIAAAVYGTRGPQA